MDDTLERTVEFGLLFDAYQSLLTDRKRQILRMRVYEDLSLAEIAEELSVSRQAIHDVLQRTLAQLREYEQLLQLVATEQRRMRQLTELTRIVGLIADVPAEVFLLLDELAL